LKKLIVHNNTDILTKLPELKQVEKKLLSFAKKLHPDLVIDNDFQTALIHKSFVKQAVKAGVAIKSNQRLELLGDSVISTAVSEYIYLNYPEMAEGDMAKVKAEVVSTETLSNIAIKIGLNKVILLSENEGLNRNNLRQSILEDAFEALMGAIFLQLGYEKTSEIALKLLGPAIKNAAKNPGSTNYKAILQEKSVKLYNQIPQYSTAFSGPDHNRIYSAKVSICSHLIGTGSGTSKKAAQQQAAKMALQNFNQLAKQRPSQH